jgi:hypothetical protein
MLPAALQFLIVIVAHALNEPPEAYRDRVGTLRPVIGRLKERAQGLLEFLVAAEARGDLIVDEDGALRPAPEASTIGLNRELEPSLAQLRDVDFIFLDVFAAFMSWG